jgi:hypothetical protein
MPQPFRLAVFASAIIIYLTALFCAVLVSFGTGAILALIAAGMMVVFYFIQLFTWRRLKLLSIPRVIVTTAALVAVGEVFLQGYSVAINSSLFSLPGFYYFHIIAGVVLLLAFAMASIHIIRETEDGRRRRILFVAIGIFVFLSAIGYLAFAGVPFTSTRFVYFSFVFAIFFFLAFFTSVAMYTIRQRIPWRHEDRVGLVLSGLMVILWFIRWGSPVHSAMPILLKALIELGIVAVVILPIGLFLSTRMHYVTLFIFYVVILDLQFLSFNLPFREFVNLGGRECVGYANADNPPLVREPGGPLGELFKPVTSEEIFAIREEWSKKEFISTDIRIEYRGKNPQGDSIKVLSHRYEGRRHYGLIRIPPGADILKAPILLALHGGGSDVDILKEEELYRFTRGCVASSQRYITIAPSFRGDVIRGDEFCFRSEGYTGDVWNGATEDAAAFLQAFKSFHRSDNSMVVAIGVSRGATVGLILGALARRVDYVIAISTHTDFLHEQIFRSERVGSDYARVFFTPQTTPSSVRKRMLLSSPFHFAEFLPAFEIHQGTEDHLTTVWHAQQLEQKLQLLNRPDSTYTIRYYKGMGHGAVDEGSVCRTLEDLTKETSPSLKALVGKSK